MDLLVSFILLVSVWIIAFLVNLDANRHKNLYFETSEFSIGINNLPTLTQDYNIKKMKAELWDHLVKIISQEKQQIPLLKKSEPGRAYEIVDI